MKFPKIEKIEVLDNYMLKVFFMDNSVKLYDFKPNFKYEFFSQLKDYNVFKNVVVDIGGYGISWNDDCDLSEAELFINGVNL